VGIIMTVAIPYMLNPDQANWRGKVGFFYGEFSLSSSSSSPIGGLVGMRS
jgi:hypothetical protein